MVSAIDTEGHHPSVTAIARWFDFGHLRAGLPADVSEACAELAQSMVDVLPDDPELTAGLRKLLEAKDCLVRAAIAKQETADADA